MKRFKNILVATDTGLSHHPIVDEAVDIAVHNGAALKIVDVVPELPWTVRLTMKDHAHMCELIGEEKRKLLEALAQPIRSRGVAVETRVLHGKTSVEIIREVMRADHDLVLRIAKGSDSRRAGFFGATGIRLLRRCPCAVWLVTPETTPQFSHVLGCVDPSTEDPLDAELNGKVYELASSISHYHGGRFSIVHAWSIYGEQMIKGRMKPEDFAELEMRSHDQVSALLSEFVARYDGNVTPDHVHLIKGEPPDVISDFVRHHDVDLIVMGTVARSGMIGMVMGNTAEQILNGIECSVLALKPDSFVCPIRPDDA